MEGGESKAGSYQGEGPQHSLAGPLPLAVSASPCRHCHRYRCIPIVIVVRALSSSSVIRGSWRGAGSRRHRRVVGEGPGEGPADVAVSSLLEGGRGRGAGSRRRLGVIVSSV